MIAIIVALDSELVAFQNKIKNKELLEAPFVLYKGTIAQKEILLCQSGVGKVEASMTATHLINNYKIDLIINSGTAGGLLPTQKFKEIIVADYCAYHDLYFDIFSNSTEEMYPFTAKLDQKLNNIICKHTNEFNLNYHRGLLVSGDQFIQSKEQIIKIKQRYPEAIAVDMESNSIAQVAKRYKKLFIVIRALSDICLRATPEDYYKYGKEASINAANIIELFLNELDLTTLEKHHAVSEYHSLI